VLRRKTIRARSLLMRVYPALKRAKLVTWSVTGTTSSAPWFPRRRGSPDPCDSGNIASRIRKHLTHRVLRKSVSRK
jgi:hypothetical protein